MLTHEQANQLDRFEHALDEEYKNKKDAIKFMRQFLSGSALPSSSGSLLQGVSALTVSPAVSRSITSEQLDLPPLDVDDGPTLIGKVAEVMERYAEEKWTMRRMLAYLQKISFPIRNSKPEASVSAALSKLSKAGRITAIRPGLGKSQGIYQWNPDYSPLDKDELGDVGEEEREMAEA